MTIEESGLDSWHACIDDTFAQ